MRLNNLKIKSQFFICFALVLTFVVVLGLVSYHQSNQLYGQVKTVAEHPMQVRRAIGALNSDILSARVALLNVLLENDSDQTRTELEQINIADADVEKQFGVLKELYLGPQSNVEDAYNAYISWKTVRNLIVDMALSGEIQKAKDSLFTEGLAINSRNKMLSAINTIDIFAKNKANTILNDSSKMNDRLHRQLILLIGAILLLSLLVSYILLRNIRIPLKQLTNASKRFDAGDMDVRVSYESKNEFGVLCSSFNQLVESIQANVELNKKVTTISGQMLSTHETKEFFQSTLQSLSLATGSQVAAVYLLHPIKNSFEHYESIGMDNSARNSFDANCPEGEFALAILTQKIQIIKEIPETTPFAFYTVNGRFVPRQIITIPIVNGKHVVAVVSLATINEFQKQAIPLIESIIDTMSARIEGVLAYQKIMEFTEVLEQQNHELDAQKSELSVQTVELTQQNNELEMQTIQLNEASRLKTNFLSNMSHELRTPLNSVIALSGVLSRRLASLIPAEEHSYLEVIERNGKNLLLLINDILDISRIEAGREEVEITTFKLNHLIVDVVDMIQPQASQKNIELIYLDSDAALTVISDIEKCRHITQNLIANAVKFTENGKVEIHTAQCGDQVQITVRDTGIGISASHIPHIFDEFRQADGSTSRKYGGTGLGLAIAKKYTNLLGGTISVESTPGEGSVFTVALPLCYMEENKIVEDQEKQDYQYSIKQTAAKPTEYSAVKTVLLVEDSEPAVIQMKDLLAEGGYHILVAHNASEAFKQIEQTIPDAMILDLMMPEIDGFELLGTLRNAEATAHVPVLILTAKHITKEELKFLKRNNIHQLIQKGDVNRTELQNAVTAMLFPSGTEVEKAPHTPQQITGKPLILVVEDNMDNMLSVRVLLSKDYTVLEAFDGNQGVAMAKEAEPNLILMDIALPGIDGIEAFHEIKKIPKLQHVPIIALTASAMVHDQKTILSHGFDGFLSKPIIETEFYKVIREVLYGK